MVRKIGGIMLKLPSYTKRGSNNREFDASYYKTEEVKKKLSRKTKILLYGNIAAGIFHLVSFIAALIVVLVLDERTRVLTSTDFVREKEIAGEEVLAVDLRVNTYEVVWLVLTVPFVTSMFHLFIGLVVPLIRPGYKLLTSGKARSGDYVLDTYNKSQGKLVTLFSRPLCIIDYYSNVMCLGINPLRWLEYSISSSLMIVVISSLSGVSNIFLIILQAFPLNVALMWIGGNYFEQENIGYSWPVAGNKFKKREPVKWRFFIWGFVFFLAQWAIIFTYFIIAASSSDNVPVYVYIIVIGLFFNFNLFAINPFLHYIRAFGWISDFANYEIVFIILSFVAKFALDWTLIIGVAVTERDVDFAS